MAFQLLGLGLGGGGGMERLHWLLERAFDEDIGQLSQTFTSVSIQFECDLNKDSG